MIAKGRNAILLERELCADASRIIGNLGCAFGMTFDQGLSFIEDGIGFMFVLRGRIVWYGSKKDVEYIT